MPTILFCYLLTPLLHRCFRGQKAERRLAAALLVEPLSKLADRTLLAALRHGREALF